MNLYLFLNIFYNLYHSKWRVLSYTQHLIYSASAVSSNLFGGASFSMSIARRKAVVHLGNLGVRRGAGCCKLSPVGFKDNAMGNFGHFEFWIAQNIALVALQQWMVTKANTRNQYFWGFGGLSLVSQTGILASK